MVESHDWTQPPFAKKEYYWPIWPTFIVIFAIFELVVVAYGLLTGRIGAGNWVPHFLRMTLVLAPIGTILTTWVYYRYARVDLSPSSITAMNDVGIRQTLLFSQIDKAFKPWYGLGLLLILKSNGVATRLWIPLYLNEWNDFALSVRQVTPPENPLRRFVESLN